jgi:membrane fusion protein
MVFVYLFTGYYSRTEKVDGFISPTNGLLQLYGSDGGVVSSVPVREGEQVKEGQILLEVSLETETSDGPAGSRQMEQMERRLAETDLQIAAAEQHFTAEEARLKSKCEAISSEISLLENRLKTEHKVLVLLGDDVERYSPLAESGNGTQFELSHRRQQELAEESSIQELERTRDSREADLVEARHQLATLPNDKTDRLSQLRATRNELLQSQAELDAKSAYAITAPVGGRIAALQANLGQSLSKTAPVIGLIPDGSNVEGQLLVPAKSIGLMRAGQEVRLRIDAFPYQRFGMVIGHVTQISKSAFGPGELIAPITYHDPVYRVFVALERTEVSAYGENRPLSVGMTFSAEIVTEEAALIDWILDPLRASKRLENKDTAL